MFCKKKLKSFTGKALILPRKNLCQYQKKKKRIKKNKNKNKNEFGGKIPYTIKDDYPFHKETFKLIRSAPQRSVKIKI